MSLYDILVTILLGIGLLFFLGGTLGIIRFPDFYTRLHPAGKVDTLATFMMCSAIILYILKHFTLANVLVSLKLVLIVVFAFMAIPTATHAIIDAGLRSGLKPWKRGEKAR